MIARILLALSLVLLAFPAEAADASAQVPEGSSAMLFALGLTGLIVGRRLAVSRKDDSETRD